MSTYRSLNFVAPDSQRETSACAAMLDSRYWLLVRFPALRKETGLRKRQSKPLQTIKRANLFATECGQRHVSARALSDCVSWPKEGIKDSSEQGDE